MTGPLERVRGLVARRVVRTQALQELAERIDEVSAGARENAELAVGLERHLDALEGDVVALAERRGRDG